MQCVTFLLGKFLLFNGIWQIVYKINYLSERLLNVRKCKFLGKCLIYSQIRAIRGFFCFYVKNTKEYIQLVDLGIDNFRMFSLSSDTGFLSICSTLKI